MKKTFKLIYFAIFIFGFSNAEAQTIELIPSFFGSMEAREIGPAVMS